MVPIVPVTPAARPPTHRVLLSVTIPKCRLPVAQLLILWCSRLHEATSMAGLLVWNVWLTVAWCLVPALVIIMVPKSGVNPVNLVF